MGLGRINKSQNLAAGASIGIHALLLGLLGFMAVKSLPTHPQLSPPIYIDIQPRPLLSGETARKPAQSASPDRAERSRPAPASGSPSRPAAQRVPSELEVAPAAASGSPADNPDNTGDRSWQVGPDAGLSGRVAQSLRTSVLGCDYPERLSREERAICDDKAGERTGRALERVPRITGTGNPERDARFEAQGRERLQSYERRRSGLPDSQRGNVGVQDGPGSNFGIGVSGQHLDPSLRPESSEPIQTRRRDGPAENRIRRTPH